MEKPDILRVVISTRTMWETHVAQEGNYDISKHDHSFVYEDKTYKYHNSGLAREVYLSDCGKWVIKVPIADYETHEELQKMIDPEEKFAYVHPAVSHNVGEAEAYKQCPKEFRTYLAKTELLPNGWVRQEYVNVRPLKGYRHDFRELGQRPSDDTYCIFDYDPLLYEFSFEGCRWDQLPKLVNEAITMISNR